MEEWKEKALWLDIAIVGQKVDDSNRIEEVNKLIASNKTLTEEINRLKEELFSVKSSRTLPVEPNLNIFIEQDTSSDIQPHENIDLGSGGILFPTQNIENAFQIFDRDSFDVGVHVGGGDSMEDEEAPIDTVLHQPPLFTRDEDLRVYRVIGGDLEGTWIIPPPKKSAHFVLRIKQLKHFFDTPTDYFKVIDTTEKEKYRVFGNRDKKPPKRQKQQHIFRPYALFILLRDTEHSFAKDFYNTSFAGKIREQFNEVQLVDIPVCDFRLNTEPNARRSHKSFLADSQLLTGDKTTQRFFEEYDEMLARNKIDETVIVGRHMYRILGNKSDPKFKAMIDFVSALIPEEEELVVYPRMYLVFQTTKGFIHNISYSAVRKIAQNKMPPVGEHVGLIGFLKERVREQFGMGPIGVRGTKLNFLSVAHFLVTQATLLQLGVKEFRGQFSMDFASTKMGGITTIDFVLIDGTQSQLYLAPLAAVKGPEDQAADTFVEYTQLSGKNHTIEFVVNNVIIKVVTYVVNDMAASWKFVDMRKIEKFISISALGGANVQYTNQTLCRRGCIRCIQIRGCGVCGHNKKQKRFVNGMNLVDTDCVQCTFTYRYNHKICNPEAFIYKTNHPVDHQLPDPVHYVKAIFWTITKELAWLSYQATGSVNCFNNASQKFTQTNPVLIRF